MVKKNPLQFALRGEGAAAVLFLGYPFRRDFRGVSPDYFSFLVLSGHREGKVTRLPRFSGLTGSRFQRAEFFDNRAPGQVRDRLTEGWPEGRAERERTSQNWDSARGRIRCTNVALKKENFRKRACFSFAFLTANPGKP